MAEIWLTAAAQDAYSELEAAAPAQARAVSDAINDITARPGEPINLPGSSPAEPFLAKEPADADAPAVIYRRTTPGERGDWLVISLMDRAQYRAARQAEQALASYPPAVQSLIKGVARKGYDVPSHSAQLQVDTITVDHGEDVPSHSAKLEVELVPLT